MHFQMHNNCSTCMTYLYLEISMTKPKFITAAPNAATPGDLHVLINGTHSLRLIQNKTSETCLTLSYIHLISWKLLHYFLNAFYFRILLFSLPLPSFCEYYWWRQSQWLFAECLLTRCQQSTKGLSWLTLCNHDLPYAILNKSRQQVLLIWKPYRFSR